MWPHWEEYKKRVVARDGVNQLYLEIGKAVIRVVEECEMQEEIDMMIAREMEIEPEHWDMNLEDKLAENKVISDAVFVVFWNHSN